MKKLGVIANCSKPRAQDVLLSLAGKAGDLGLELIADESTASLLRAAPSVTTDATFDSADVVMALGGDGTMLRVVRALNGRAKPVIGVNIGGLGFLTSVSEDDLGRALECLVTDDFIVGVRAVAEGVVVRGGSDVESYRALNDVVISSGSSRVVTLDLVVDTDRVTPYVCDGLIISTPTGSTGHSLSAGGPILSPETPAFVVSLICPHTLSSRPLVLPDKSEISVTAVESAPGLRLSVDGQVGQSLEQGDTVKVRRSGKSAHFIHLPGHSYFRVLRQKLHWSGSNV